MIREAVGNALKTETLGFDGQEEPKELRKARLAGSAQARKQLAGKTAQELQAAYLSIEAKAEKELDDIKTTFLRGACEAVGRMLKKLGVPLPRPSSNPWTR